jgi:purine catabolism regulator
VPASINILLRSSALKLRLITPEPGGPGLDEPVSWVHSSDLADPTPFLDAGQVLLTDGTQFPLEDPAERIYDEYVSRLVDHGIRGLGFATQVIHGKLPEGLITACRQYGLPLFEVPDRTPFIAVIRLVADYLAKEQNARAEWSLQAQRAIARAALRPDGLTSIMGELERQLHCWVALFDAAGNQVRMPGNQPLPSDLAPAVGAAVRAALEQGSRSASQLQIDGQRMTLQTLGRRNRLRGVLALGAIEPLDPARTDIINSVIALASLALEQARTLDTARRHLRAGVFEQLLSGSTEVAARTAQQVWGRLPSEPVTVTVAQPAGHGPDVLEALELLADDHRGAVFYAQRGDKIVVLSGSAQQGKVAALLDRCAVSAGSSSETTLADLGKALAEGEMALQRALELSRRMVQFSELSGSGMMGLLRRGNAEVVAQALLQPLIDQDQTQQTELVRTVRSWVANNCAWDVTARQLGIHRHTLRNRIDMAGTVLGLNLDSLRDRLELFAALEFRNPQEGLPTP